MARKCRAGQNDKQSREGVEWITAATLSVLAVNSATGTPPQPPFYLHMAVTHSVPNFELTKRNPINCNAKSTPTPTGQQTDNHHIRKQQVFPNNLLSYENLEHLVFPIM